MKLPLSFLAALAVNAAVIASTPNIIFILADDQSWNGTSVRMMPNLAESGSKRFYTPNIERLASQGMTFSQAYAAHCKCECSRAAIQMGRTTTTLNAPDKMSRDWSAPDTESLANLLKRAAPEYRAAHLGKWQWSHTPQSLGYDVSDGITMNEDGDSTDPNDPKRSFSMTQRAKGFIATQTKEHHPFYLQLSYYAVHPVPQALPSTLQKYETSGQAKGGKGDKAVMVAMTEDLDTCVGELMNTLDDLHIADNTLVIYTSDNGGRTEILNGGKGDLGEGGLRVPMIVRGPGIKAGSHCDVPVISYDLSATVIDYASPQSPLPRGIEGGSWKSVLTNAGKGAIKRPIERLVWHQAVEVDHPQSAIRQGDYKLLYFWDSREGLLFDLANDLSETRDAAKQHPEIAAKLERELKAHIRAGLGEQAFAALERGETGQQRGKGERPRKRPMN